MLRRRAFSACLVLSLAALAGPGVLSATASPPEDTSKAPADDTAKSVPPWMVAFEATDAQPMGMKPSDIETFLDKQVKSVWKAEKSWSQTWERVFLLMTPDHKTPVPAFALSRFEVTNAQWARFLEERTQRLTTQGGETLASLAADVWALDPDRQAGDVQRGWMNLIATNSAVLLPVLNPNGDAKWDPQKERVAEKKLPAGLVITYPRYPYPPHWKDGKVPDEERRRPARFLSWEQCEDFCQWAGFHLPTEAEWERAARGSEGRWFPWGNEWDGTRIVWKKYNDAAVAAAEAAKKKGETPTVAPLAHDPPEPVEVDSFPQGATPEGIHHLIGNVSEFVGNRSTLYPGSKTQFKFGGAAQLTRGGNYEDRAEVLLAADRNADSHQGALLAGHSVAGYGFRLAMSPVAGADIAASVAQTWSDRVDKNSPWNWQPLPAGISDRKKAEPYFGFDLQNTAGVIQRSLSNDDKDHVFVVGAAQGVAFLPVKGFPYETVKGTADVTKFASDADRPLLLGLLVGTDNLGVTVRSPQTEGEPTDTVVEFKDPKHLLEQADTRLYTKADKGLMLVLDGDKVVVYIPDSTVGGIAKWRTAPLGFLAEPAKLDADREGKPSEGVMDGTAAAVLTARIPLLAKDGHPQKGAPSIRVTIRVPVVPR